MMKRLTIALAVLLLAALACNLPNAQSQGQEADLTQVVQTLVAQMSTATAAAAQGGSTLTATATLAPSQLTATATPSPTLSATPQPASATPQPCNLASFVADVTVPDDTKVLVGQSFNKIWRFRNVGTCTWNSSYQVVFDHGDQMGGPVTQPFPAGIVPPGGTVDISLNLTAPGSANNYAGYWRFRDPTSVLFGLSTGSFWVKIKAVQPTPTPTATVVLPPPAIAVTVDVPLVGGESGSVRSDGTVLGFPNVGDIESNAGSQGFLSFDISAIPAAGHVIAVKLDFSNYDTLGNPFVNLGYLRMYAQNFGSVDASDYFGGVASGAVVRWASAGELNSTAGVPDPSIIAYLQSKVGGSRVQFRVQFNDHATNSDGVADMVRFGNAIKLIVTYTQ